MRNLYLKLASRIDDIEMIKTNHFPYPKSLTIFPSEVCNLKCKGCNSLKLHKKDGLMNIDLFREIVEDFKEKGGRAVAFEGGGEPMMHPEMFLMIRFCKMFYLETGMITNGTIFRECMLDLDWVRVSIPFPTNELYKKMTGGDLSKVKENLKRLKLGKGTVGIKLLSSKLCHAPEIIGQFPQVDYIQVKDLRNCELSDVKNLKYVKPCGITPLRAVVDYDGTFYPCPFFHSQKSTKISKDLMSKWWGGDEHLRAISNIKNCNEYDCPFANIDWQVLNEAHLSFI
jgi:MoaA/NifB/PqqE/SkfB family radical SAM enzyme